VFDIGPGEIIGLAIVAMIVLGPDKLPRYAADAARMLRQLRRMANEAKSEVRKELGPEMQDLSLTDLNPRSLLRKHLLEPMDLDDIDDLGGSRKPPVQRGPGGGPAAAPGTPPRYDEDAT
jgi:sec-independent protein translocase protein TatB